MCGHLLGALALSRSHTYSNRVCCCKPIKRSIEGANAKLMLLRFSVYRNRWREEIKTWPFQKFSMLLWYLYDLHASSAFFLSLSPTNNRWSRIVFNGLLMAPIWLSIFLIHNKPTNKQKKKKHPNMWLREWVSGGASLIKCRAKHLLPHYYDQISFELTGLWRFNREKEKHIYKQ